MKKVKKRKSRIEEISREREIMRGKKDSVRSEMQMRPETAKKK